MNRISDATKEDRAYGIDRWALLFKAKTWEEIKMLAKKDSAIEKAATSIYDLSADEAIAWECEARADYERRQKGIQQTIAKYKGERDDAVAKAKALQKRIAELEARLDAQSQNGNNA